jgi:hypothetical protein
MHTIHKYPLDFFKEPIQFQIVALKAGGDDCKPLCIQLQNDRPCLWVQLDLESPTIKFLQVQIVGTGQSIEDPELHGYLSTIQHLGFVWHFYVADYDKVREKARNLRIAKSEEQPPTFADKGYTIC